MFLLTSLPPTTGMTRLAVMSHQLPGWPIRYPLPAAYFKQVRGCPPRAGSRSQLASTGDELPYVVPAVVGIPEGGRFDLLEVEGTKICLSWDSLGESFDMSRAQENARMAVCGTLLGVPMSG